MTATGPAPRPPGADVVVRLPAGRGVRELRLDARAVGRLRVGLLVAAAVQAVTLAALVLLGPRALGYSALVDENLALRRQLASVAARMDEADAMLERLRLYDAELRSLTRPRGDHGGPIPTEALSNAGLDDLHGAYDDTEYGDGPVVDAGPPTSRPADAWADDVAERVGGFVDLFALSEADLNGLVSDLDALRAIRDALPSAWPADGSLTSGFGWRRDPLRRSTRFHAGVDIANGYGTTVRATAAGVVSRSTYASGFGNVIEIDHGYGIMTRYAHLARRRVRVGQRVERADPIGTMGSTGRSTGPHLHFELHVDGSAHDPMTYLPR